MFELCLLVFLASVFIFINYIALATMVRALKPNMRIDAINQCKIEYKYDITITDCKITRRLNYCLNPQHFRHANIIY